MKLKRLHTDTKIALVLGIVACIIIAFQLQGCSGIQIVTPGPAQLGELAWSVSETALVFLPEEYRESWLEWKPDVEELKDILDAGDPISGEWVKEQFVEKLAIVVMGVIDKSDELTDMQKEVLVDDFNRAFGLVAVEGDFILSPTQRTVIYGAVRGVLSAFARWEQDPLKLQTKKARIGKDLEKRATPEE